MCAVLETYAVSNSQRSTREELFYRDDIRTYERGSSEATALANAQFKFQQELNNYKQKRSADLINPSYSSRKSSSDEEYDGAESLFVLSGVPISLIIGIAAMRSTFSSYFPTRNLFPANGGDWIATVFYCLFPIPIGWVAWGAGSLILVIWTRLLFVVLFPKK